MKINILIRSIPALANFHQTAFKQLSSLMNSIEQVNYYLFVLIPIFWISTSLVHIHVNFSPIFLLFIVLLLPIYMSLHYRFNFAIQKPYYTCCSVPAFSSTLFLRLDYCVHFLLFLRLYSSSSFFSLWYYVVFCNVNIPQPIYPSSAGGGFGCFQSFCHYEQCCYYNEL